MAETVITLLYHVRARLAALRLGIRPRGAARLPCAGKKVFRARGAKVSQDRAHTNGCVQQRTLLRRVLRRVLETAFEKVLRRVLRRCLAAGFSGKKGSEKGSYKGF